MQDIANLITTIISNCGFPIAAFLLMFWQNKKTTDMILEVKDTVAKNTDAINDMKEALKSAKGGDNQ